MKWEKIIKLFILIMISLLFASCEEETLVKHISSSYSPNNKSIYKITVKTVIPLAARSSVKKRRLCIPGDHAVSNKKENVAFIRPVITSKDINTILLGGTLHLATGSINDKLLIDVYFENVLVQNDVKSPTFSAKMNVYVAYAKELWERVDIIKHEYTSHLEINAYKKFTTNI